MFGFDVNLFQDGTVTGYEVESLRDMLGDLFARYAVGIKPRCTIGPPGNQHAVGMRQSLKTYQMGSVSSNLRLGAKVNFLLEDDDSDTE